MPTRTPALQSTGINELVGFMPSLRVKGSCTLTSGVGHGVCHLVKEHGGCYVRSLGKACDLESNLQETHDVGMYGWTLCGCDVMKYVYAFVGVVGGDEYLKTKGRMVLSTGTRIRRQKGRGQSSMASSRGRAGHGHFRCVQASSGVAGLAPGKREHPYLVDILVMYCW